MREIPEEENYKKPAHTKEYNESCDLELYPDASCFWHMLCTGKSATQMLRITEIPEDDKTITFKLEGKLIGVWITYLDRKCAYRKKKGYTVVLDFSGVTFIERKGVSMLERIKDGRMKAVNCSPFIRSILSKVIDYT